jgi:hypothetical protein
MDFQVSASRVRFFCEKKKTKLKSEVLFMAIAMQMQIGKYGTHYREYRRCQGAWSYRARWA